MIRISQRGTVAPFYAMDVLAEANRLAAEGKPVLSLAVGQPGAQAPEAVRRAAANAARVALLAGLMLGGAPGLPGIKWVSAYDLRYVSGGLPSEADGSADDSRSTLWVRDQPARPLDHAALTAMGQAGAGVLLYLNQEGRGIGLANKMRAYDLQAQGFDTVQANHRLGFEDDERDFRLGAAMLRQLGFSAVRLMTNNPRKLDELRRAGFEVVERVPIQIVANPFNAAYLETKARKMGHLLDPDA